MGGVAAEGGGGEALHEVFGQIRDGAGDDDGRGLVLHDFFGEGGAGEHGVAHGLLLQDLGHEARAGLQGGKLYALGHVQHCGVLLEEAPVMLQEGALLLAGDGQDDAFGVQHGRIGAGLDGLADAQAGQIGGVFMQGVDGMADLGPAHVDCCPVAMACRHVRQGRAPAAAAGNADGELLERHGILLLGIWRPGEACSGALPERRQHSLPELCQQSPLAIIAIRHRNSSSQAAIAGNFREGTHCRHEDCARHGRPRTIRRRRQARQDRLRARRPALPGVASAPLPACARACPWA